MKPCIHSSILAAFFLGLGVRSNPAAPSDHPRLLLNPEKIKSLKSAILTETQQRLWDLARERADAFCRLNIPSMNNADNRYRYIGDTMPVLGLAYHLTGERRYAEAAIRWMNALLNVPDWRGSQNLGRSSWMVGCAFLYDWLYPVLDQGLKDRIRARLVSEADRIVKQNFSYRLLSNHCLIETSAMGLTGFVLEGETEEAKAIQRKAAQWTEQIIARAPLDGSWVEGVGYWKYGLGYFIRYLEASRTGGWKNYYPAYDWLKITGFFPIYFSLPGLPRNSFNFSDSQIGTDVPPFILYLLASAYGNGTFQDFGNRMLQNTPDAFHWLDFLLYDPGIQPQDYTRLPVFKHFADNGFVVMRTGWETNAVAIGFHCGPAPGRRNQNDPELIARRGFGPGHMHPDINSFSIFAYGQWMAIDPGYTHLKQTRNHNTVLVNGFGQTGEGAEWLDYLAFEKRNPAPDILRVESNADYDYAIGDAGNVYPDEAQLATFRRHLLFLKPDVVIVADDLEAKASSNFEWLLNAHGPFSGKGNTLHVDRNGTRMVVHPLLPASCRIRTMERRLDALDVKGSMQTLTLKADSLKKTRYLVVLDILKDSLGAALDVRFSQNRLTLRKGNASWILGLVPFESVVRASDPVFIVEKPKRTSDADYFYVRPE